MADIHGSPADAASQPQATNSGSAPVPYRGPDQSAGNPPYNPDMGPMGDAAGEVMNGIGPNSAVQESAAAHSIAAGLADAPYDPGSPDPIFAGGDDDAGGRDDVGASVQAAVDNATARWNEFQSDTYGQGSTIGDLMTFPPGPLDPGAGVGNISPLGGFYDPPREYT